MADEEQLQQLLASSKEDNGCADWNRFREQSHRGINLEGANLSHANLSHADLSHADLRYANLGSAKLNGANLQGANLDRCDLKHVQAAGAIFKRANLNDTEFTGANLIGANFQGATMNSTFFMEALLTRADLSGADVRTSNFSDVNLSGANLRKATFTGGSVAGATLFGTDLRGADLRAVDFSGATMSRSIFDLETDLTSVTLDSQTQLGDVHWNGVDVTVVDWGQIRILGDESVTPLEVNTDEGFPVQAGYGVVSVGDGIGVKLGDNAIDYNELYTSAFYKFRANKQIAIQLRSQGISDHADRVAFRAQLWQRKIYREQGIHGVFRYLGTLILALTSGYGYRPIRTLVLYLFVILGFAIAYCFLLAPSSSIHISLLGSFVFSVSSFHGRGFFPGPNISLDAPITVAAAGEAIIGLLIEVSFIATFTQRFFGR